MTSFQFSENFQANIVNLTSHPNLDLTESSTAAHMNVPHVIHASIHNPETYAMMAQFPQPPQLQQTTFQLTSPIQPVHPSAFFYKPPNDICNYHIKCKEISLDLVIQLLN